MSKFYAPNRLGPCDFAQIIIIIGIRFLGSFYHSDLDLGGDLVAKGFDAENQDFAAAIGRKGVKRAVDGEPVVDADTTSHRPLHTKVRRQE